MSVPRRRAHRYGQNPKGRRLERLGRSAIGRCCPSSEPWHAINGHSFYEHSVCKWEAGGLRPGSLEILGHAKLRFKDWRTINGHSHDSP